MTQNDFVVILSTSPCDEAERIAERLVDEHLAACVNITEVRSIFHWEGELCNEKESLMVIKTKRAMVETVISRIREIHPYEIPEIIVLPIAGGYDAYLSWISNEVDGA